MIASQRIPATYPLTNTSTLDVEILAGIISASNDACWCMEFSEPVDLTAPEREIVRQVFENDPFWRFTNPAMARLYLLEPKKDFNSRPTSEIFPWNEQNEAFVRNLIDNGFEMDAGPALDTRYDGVQIYVENDVRAHIEGGKLLRIFGIVRNVGKHRLREETIQEELSEALNILMDLPCGAIAFNEVAEVIAVNPAACKLLGIPMENLLAGALSQNTQSSDVMDTVRRVIATGQDETIVENLVGWNIAARKSGGAVVCLQPNDAEVHHS
ncbi:hypothetical protein SuNHUV7_27520 (plasmid) [Pseudoseohaeicola sp. NH-UV-7]